MGAGGLSLLCKAWDHVNCCCRCGEQTDKEPSAPSCPLKPANERHSAQAQRPFVVQEISPMMWESHAGRRDTQAETTPRQSTLWLKKGKRKSSNKEEKRLRLKTKKKKKKQLALVRMGATFTKQNENFFLMNCPREPRRGQKYSHVGTQ